MGKILQLIRLNLKLILARKSIVAIYLIVSVISVYLVANLYSQVERGFRFPVAFVDEDGSRFSEEVIQAVEANDLIQVEVMADDEALAKLRDNQIEAIITIEEGAGTKVESGLLENLIQVDYLKDNTFTMMLMDILSKDILAEVSILSAARYYNEGYKALVNEKAVGNIYNKVYNIGKELDLTDKTQYYLDIEMVGDVGRELEWYNQSLFLEKMTIGILYILIAFFVLFAGLWILKQHENPSSKKLKLRYSSIHRTLGDWLSLVIMGLCMTMPILVVSVIYGKDLGLMVTMNSLYILSTGAFVYLLILLIPKVELYLMLGTSLMLLGGIMTGSFFPIDYENPLVAIVATMFPGYYSSRVYFDPGFLGEFTVFAGLYMVLLIGCSVLLKKTFKKI